MQSNSRVDMGLVNLRRCVEKEHIRAVALLEKLIFDEPYAWPEDDFVEEALSPMVFVFSIEYDGSPCGSLMLEQCQGGLEITSMGVLPEYQCRGIATTVARRVVALASSIGLIPWLHVATGNEGAQSVYNKVGFRVVDKLPDHYDIGRHAYLMVYGG